MRASLTLPLLLVLGCADDPVVLRAGTTELRFQNPPTEVDILLIVDDSCSMYDEQQKLGEGFDSFVTYFDEADVDYHIGVTTTDVSMPDVGLGWPGGPRGELVRDGQTGLRVLTRDTEDAAAAFRRMVQVGTDGSGLEQGLQASMLALREPNRSGVNAGFLRDSALLSVIVVSDEDDGSNYPVSEWIDDLRALKGQRRRDAVNASALTGVDADTGEPIECGRSFADPNAGAAPAYRYHDVATRLGGVVGSICEDSFTDIVARMGLKSSRLQDRFELGRQPDLDSLEVTLFLSDAEEDEGIEVPPEGVDGQWPWAYEEDEIAGVWTVRFTDITSLPPLDSRIVFYYEAR